MFQRLRIPAVLRIPVRRQVACIGGLLEAPIQQYYNTAILFAANDAPGALLDADQTREAERVIETVELQRVEILLYQFLLTAELGQADADDDGADQGVAAVIDALGEASAHDGKTELSARPRRTVAKNAAVRPRRIHVVAAGF